MKKTSQHLFKLPLLLLFTMLSGCMMQSKFTTTNIINNSSADLSAIIDRGTYPQKAIATFCINDTTSISVGTININGILFLTSEPDTIIGTDVDCPNHKLKYRIGDLEKLPILVSPYPESPREFKIIIPANAEVKIGEVRYNKKKKNNPPPMHWSAIKILDTNDRLITSIHKFSIEQAITKKDTTSMYLGRYATRTDFRNLIEIQE